MAVQIISGVLTGEELTAKLQELKAQAERGELHCLAMRVYRSDNTFEDVVVGGTEEERAEALAGLKRIYQGAQ